MSSIVKNVRGVITEFTCGYCTAQAGYTIVCADYSEERSPYGDFLGGEAFALLRCNHCKRLSVVVFDLYEDEYRPIPEIYGADDLSVYLMEHPEIISGYYETDVGMLANVRYIKERGRYPWGHTWDDKVPSEIRSNLEEALNCLAVGAFNAVGVMSRRVIERVALHFGIKERRLKTTIEKLFQKGVVSKEIRDGFDEIRKWGNIGAHPSKGEPNIEREEAQLIAKYTLMVVEHIFQSKSLLEVRDELTTRRSGKEK